MTLPLAPFGRTGHRSTRVLFGAAALGGMSQDRALATLEVVRSAGVNHIDTAAAYGASEDRLRPWLAEHRNEVFLATKTGKRSGDAARAELERSLERMGVDHVDLVQLHNLVEENEWAVALGPGGAVEALERARDQGLTRAIGVTGHGLRIARMHLRSLERFDVDSVLLPYNFALSQSSAYRAEVEELLGVCAERNVAVQIIKSVARRRWPDGYDGRRFSWYEPLRDEAAIARAVRFVLGHDGVFLNTSSDLTILRPTLEAASVVGAVPSEEELAADGASPLFDGSALERI